MPDFCTDIEQPATSRSPMHPHDYFCATSRVLLVSHSLDGRDNHLVNAGYLSA